MDKLERLRPVSFHLKSDPTDAVQYGLIAEEVDKVYPELVIRDSAGMSQGVRYDELAPLLLSEIQRQRRQLKVAAANAAFQEHRIQAQEHSIEAHQRVIHAQAGQLAEVDARVSELTGRMPEIRGTTTE
jgi:cell division FtsZ-interacting protein ZapD